MIVIEAKDVLLYLISFHPRNSVSCHSEVNLSSVEVTCQSVISSNIDSRVSF